MLIFTFWIFFYTRIFGMTEVKVTGKVTGSHIHCKSANVLKLVQDREVFIADQ